MISSMPTKCFKFFGILLLLSFCYMLLPVVVHAAYPQRCPAWSSREITKDKVSASEMLSLAHDTRIIKVPSRLAAILPRQGLSLPGLIALPDSRTVEPASMLLWHEVAHQYQYRRDGLPRFFAKYVFEWHRGLLSGCSFADAYRSISYEREAGSIAFSYARPLYLRSLSGQRPFGIEVYYSHAIAAANLARHRQGAFRDCCKLPHTNAGDHDDAPTRQQTRVP